MKYRIAKDGKSYVVQTRLFGFMWITLLERRTLIWRKATFETFSDAEMAMHENANRRRARQNYVREYSL